VARALAVFLLVINTAWGSCTIVTGSPLSPATIRYHPNTQYTQTIQTSGCTSPVFSVVAGALPIGLGLDPTTGVIGGSLGTCLKCNGGTSGATLAGVYNFTVQVKDSSGSSVQPYALTLSLGLPALTVSSDHRVFTVDYGNGTKRHFYRGSAPPETFTPSGTIYYADAKIGNDSNPCSQTEPCQTITQAVSKISAPGDTVYVNPGNYAEQVVIAKSGAPADPIIVTTAPGHTWEAMIALPDRILNGNTVTTTVSVRENTTDVIFNGFIVVGELGRAGSASNDGGNIGTALFIRDQGTNRIALTNNIVFNGLSNGIKGGVVTGGSYTADGNVSFNNGTGTLNHGIYAYADNWVIKRNYVFDNTGFGIHCYSSSPTHPQSQVISANVSLYNGLSGIVISGKNNKIDHNIAVLNATEGFTCYQVNCIDNTVTNNILAFNSTASLTEDLSTGGSNSYDYNIFWPQWPRLGPESSLGLHDQNVNPNFVSNNTGDFRISPATPVPCRGCYLEPLAGPCDLNSDGAVNVLDVQIAMDLALGILPCTGNIFADGTCGVTDVQRVITAALGGACI
jgi:hypothetical protein